MIRSFFKSKWFWVMVFFLVIQQCVVASSVYWLAHAAEALARGEPFQWYLLLYGLCLILPFIVGYHVMASLERWTLAAIQSFCGFFTGAFDSRIEFFEEGPATDNARSILAKESSALTAKFTDYVNGVLASFLNFSLSLLVVAYVVDLRLLLVFGGSLAATYCLIRFNRKRYATYATHQQSAMNDYSAALLRGWDSLVIGNRLNKNIWRDRTANAARAFHDATMKACLFDQRQATAIGLLGALPSIVFVVFQILSASDKAVAAAALASFPRVFQIIVSTHSVLTGLSQWQGYKAKLALIEGQLPKDKQLGHISERIQIQKIKIEKDGVPLALDSIEQSFGILSTPGRYTVTGANGAGKSTLLKLWKTHFQDQAFYLPARHQLLFRSDEAKGSSGEKTRYHIEEALGEAGVAILLLDEWDANLDDVNTAMLNRQIDGMARSRIVVEVRHA
jgi:ABC-type bacteriocin/lantibiotic exporter with double-glycine peptidase domain